MGGKKIHNNPYIAKNSKIKNMLNMITNNKFIVFIKLKYKAIIITFVFGYLSRMLISFTHNIDVVANYNDTISLMYYVIFAIWTKFIFYLSPESLQFSTIITKIIHLFIGGKKNILCEGNSSSSLSSLGTTPSSLSSLGEQVKVETNSARSRSNSAGGNSIINSNINNITTHLVPEERVNSFSSIVTDNNRSILSRRTFYRNLTVIQKHAVFNNVFNSGNFDRVKINLFIEALPYNVQESIVNLDPMIGGTRLLNRHPYNDNIPAKIRGARIINLLPDSNPSRTLGYSSHIPLDVLPQLNPTSNLILGESMNTYAQAYCARYMELVRQPHCTLRFPGKNYISLNAAEFNIDVNSPAFQMILNASRTMPETLREGQLSLYQRLSGCRSQALKTVLWTTDVNCHARNTHSFGGGDALARHIMNLPEDNNTNSNDNTNNNNNYNYSNSNS